MSATHPLVTVLMPVYNGQDYLKDAIDSILAQTFADFEFLIINDGSTDATESIILSYTDPRINYVKNPENIKLISTLNKGLALAKGKYIARMDADDISLPTRLAAQISYMEQHPEIGLCGSYIQTLEAGSEYVIKYQTESDQIKFRLLFDTHFPHPAAVLRKSVLVDNKLEYELDYIHAEDYVLWNRMALHTGLHNIPEVLVLKRSHAAQVSIVHNQLQQTIMSAFRKEIMEAIMGPITPGDYYLYENLLLGTYPEEKEKAIALINFLNAFVLANRQKQAYNTAILENHFGKLAFSIAYNASALGAGVFSAFNKSAFATQQSPATKAKLFFKYSLKKAPANKLIIQTV